MKFTIVAAIFAAVAVADHHEGVVAPAAPAPAPAAPAPAPAAPAPAAPKAPMDSPKAPAGKNGKKYTSTIYDYKTYTVTDCPDYVTKCPADKYKVVTSTYAAYETMYDADDYDSDYSSTYSSAAYPVKSDYPSSCSYKVKTISTTYTTAYPTVYYETVTDDCYAKPTYPASSAYPSAYPSAYKNNSTAPEKPKYYTAGAGSNAASFALAAVAGLAAYAFA
jgi:hypothetical protein